jgi:hypothetical protein
MLKPLENGLMYGKKVETLENVTPTDYSYSSQPPYRERAYRLGPLSLGMGERTQTAAVGMRYRYAINMDCSIGGLPRKGPFFTSITPASSGEIRGMCEFPISGTMKLFTLAGRYCLVRNGDNIGDWSVSKDFGAGRVAQSVVRFKDAGGTDALYVTLDNGELWQFTGVTDTTAWTACVLPASGPGALPAYLEVVGDELWYGAGNKISKAVTGPTLAANWSGWINVGDASRNITYLKQLANQLLIFKTNGIYTVNTSGSDYELFPGLRMQPLLTNGRNATAWINSIFIPYGPTFYKATLGSETTIQPVGLERLLENNSEVSGQIVCSAGHSGWFLYLGVNNSISGNSYLCKLGSWLQAQEGYDADFVYSETIHGALCKWAGKQITWMSISDTPGPNPRLYAGFADGSISWALLPRTSPDPASDINCRFTTEVGQIFWPIHHSMFQADSKDFRGFSVFGPRLDKDNYVRFKYRLADALPYTDLGTDFIAGGQRSDLPNNVSGKAIDVCTEFINETTETTPIVEGMALHESVRPALKLDYNFVVQAKSHLARRDGSVDRRDAEQIRQAVKDAAQVNGTVTMIMPDETSQEMTITNYSESLAPSSSRYGLTWDLGILATQYKMNTIYGTLDRLAAFTLDDLAVYTLDQLEVL